MWLQLLFLLISTCFAQQQQTTLLSLQQCASKTKTDPNTFTTYTCTGRNSEPKLTSVNLPESVLSSCKFIRCGLMIFQKNITLTNMVFEFSSMAVDGAVMTGDNLTFTGNDILKDGGALLVMAQSKATLTSSLFMNNTSKSPQAGGGAIAVRENAELYISSCTFINNTASNRGGSIYMFKGSIVDLQDTHFMAGKALTSRGGDIYNAGGSLTWTRGTSKGFILEYFKDMVNGTNQGPSGGSIGVDKSSTVTLRDIRFQDQRVSMYGAVLYTDNGEANNKINITMNNITTVNTRAESFGGVFYLLSSTQVACTDCVFINGSARDSGGAIVTNGELLLDRIISHNCNVDKGSGSFLGQSESSNLIIKNSLINGSYFNNQQEFNVGGILIQGNVTLMNTTLSENRASIGSAIIAIGSPSTMFNTVNTTDSVFIRNKASLSSGAVGINNFKSMWTNVRFESNEAADYAGALEFQIFDKDAYPALFYGKFECYNNVVLRLLDGSGGCIAGDTQTSLAFNTNELFFKGNRAVYGSDVFMSCYYDGGSKGNLTYSPRDPPTRPGPQIEGTWYFYREAFAEYIASAGVLNRLDPNLKADSRPMGAILKYEQDIDRLNYSHLTLDYELPALNVAVTNLLSRNVTKIGQPCIVRMTVTAWSGQRLASAYKVVLPEQTDYSVTFKSVYLSRSVIPENFNSLLNVTFAAINRNADGVEPKVFEKQTSTLHFRVPLCDPLTSAVVPLYVTEKGKTVFGCVIKLSVSASYQYVLISISAGAILMAMFMGYVAHHFREMNVYRTFSSFFTNLITFGCIVQFISVIFRSLVSLQFPGACMLSEFLELLGFTLVLSCIIVKTYRIRAIFIRTLQHRGSPESISNAVLGLYVMLAMVLVLVFILVWSFTRPLTVGLEQVGGEDGWVQTDKCKMMGQGVNFNIISVSIHILLILVAVSFAHECRRVPSTYNETKTILWISYSWLIGCAVLFPLGEFLLIYPNSSFILQCIRIYAPNLLTLGLIHVPRMYVALFKKELDPKKNSIFNSSKDKSTKKQHSSAKLSSGSHMSDVIVKRSQKTNTSTDILKSS